MWDLSSIRKLAIEELLEFKMDPVTRITLARQYSVQKWLFAGYEELAKRTEPISIREAEQLGWDTAILIFQIREESLAGFQTTRIVVTQTKVEDECREEQTVKNYIKGPFDRTYCSCSEGIWRVFAKELKDAEE